MLVFLGSAIGTFPLFVPPFFIPQYAKTLGFSSSVGAALVAGFSLASAFGRISSGYMSDNLGALNTVFASLVLTAVTMLAIWPASTTMAPLIAFVILNGAANGAFFSTMPTAVSNVFGSARVATSMSMVITGWVGGYLMVSASIDERIWGVFFSDANHFRGRQLQDISSKHMEALREACRHIVLLCFMPDLLLLCLVS